jgi:hypothetical protein
MPRLVPPALLISIFLLAAAPGAVAKEISGMKICGREGCVPLKPGVAQRFHNTGALNGKLLRSDPGPVPHYRLIMLYGDGNGGIAHRGTSAYAPSLRAIVPLDANPPVSWWRVTRRAAARLNGIARDLTMFGARRLKVDNGVEPPKVYRAWREADVADSDDGLPPPLVAGLPAVFLVGLGLFAFRRRRAG